MKDAAVDFGAISETTVFLDFFKNLPDPRQPGKVVYPLDEILLLCLPAVLGGSETFVDIARFGEKKLDLLRRFRPFRHITPADDHLGDIFANLCRDLIAGGALQAGMAPFPRRKKHSHATATLLPDGR